MKTVIKSIVIILLEIVIICGLLFACMQFLPGKDEVVIDEAALSAGEGDAIESNAGAAIEGSESEDVDDSIGLDESEAEDGEASEPVEGENVAE